MLIRNVPIVIEPGVSTLEAEFVVNDVKSGAYNVPIHLHRVALDETAIGVLPLVPTTRLPHVFSITTDLKKSVTLVVYDSLGRIAVVYTRDKAMTHWDRLDVAEEHAGKSVTQFSVRFSFNTAKERLKFLTLMEKITEEAGRDVSPQMDDVMGALRILARSRVAPVVLPVAVEKCTMGKIKL